jgi:threonylcarbamoyladenosine tRNA methylthiotransferase MtaB
MERNKIAFYTLGCKVNHYDTQVMKEAFKSSNYEIVDFNTYADIYVINTCTVTHLSDRKSRQMIRKAKRTNPYSIICATGCYVQISEKEIISMPEIDIVLGTKDHYLLPKLIEKYTNTKTYVADIGNIRDEKIFDEKNCITNMDNHTRAYVKIQDGCDPFCSYCIIPYTRGKVRSRNPESIINEIKRLVANGYQEVVITGIHIDKFGIDLNNWNLQKLLVEIHKIENLKRIRLGSLEPNTMTDEFIIQISKLKKICPHFHLSLQSGCDEVLMNMNRKYTSDKYKETIDKIRNHFDKPAITTDIIVGFPGETDQNFNETIKFVYDIGFYQIHVFKYSKREGTVAAGMKNQINDATKKVRSQKLIEASIESEIKFLETQINTKQEILLEKHIAPDMWSGYSKKYIPVIVKSKKNLHQSIECVKLKQDTINIAKEKYILGEFIEQKGELNV